MTYFHTVFSHIHMYACKRKFHISLSVDFICSSRGVLYIPIFTSNSAIGDNKNDHLFIHGTEMICNMPRSAASTISYPYNMHIYSMNSLIWIPLTGLKWIRLCVLFWIGFRWSVKLYLQSFRKAIVCLADYRVLQS